MRFSWPEIKGATQYRFQIAPDGRFETLLADKLVSATSAEYESLPEGRYAIRVRQESEPDRIVHPRSELETFGRNLDVRINVHHRPASALVLGRWCNGRNVATDFQAAGQNEAHGEW